MDIGQYIGKYEVVAKLGDGQFATTYMAREPAAGLGRTVVLKVLSSTDESLLRRFLAEARMTATLSGHRNITAPFDFDEHDGRPYLVLEYLPGEDLRECIREKRTVALRTKVIYLLQVAEALLYAHSKDIIHRDVKPENIRVLANGTVKIMDFGIGKNLSPRSPNQTIHGTLLGTPGYLAPEQYLGHTDIRTDIYSYGVVAYELLTYRHPFSGPIEGEYVVPQKDKLPSVEELEADCTQALAVLVHRCLEDKPEDRFQGFGEVVSTLRRQRDQRNLEAHQANQTIVTSQPQELVDATKQAATVLTPPPETTEQPEQVAQPDSIAQQTELETTVQPAPSAARESVAKQADEFETTVEQNATVATPPPPEATIPSAPGGQQESVAQQPEELETGTQRTVATPPPVVTSPPATPAPAATPSPAATAGPIAQPEPVSPPAEEPGVASESVPSVFRDIPEQWLSKIKTAVDSAMLYLKAIFIAVSERFEKGTRAPTAWILGGGVLVLILVVAEIAFPPPPPPPAETNNPQPVQEQTLVQEQTPVRKNAAEEKLPPSRQAATGRVFVDAFPWGRLTQIAHNETGISETREQQCITPCYVELETGTYTLYLKNSDTRTVESCITEIRPNQTSLCRVSFKDQSTQEYFEDLGWWN